MKKLVFLNPCNYNSPSNQSHAPLSFGYLASYLGKNIDEEFNFSVEVDVERVIARKPDIVGISAYTESYMQAISAAKKIKKELKNTFVLLGGKHISALPVNFNHIFDLGIYGEGEQTLTEIILLYLQGRLEHQYLQKVNGIVYYHDQEKIITPPRIEVPSLDLLPKPRRDIMHAWFPNISAEWYWPQAIYTSRGCPYVCHFCVHSTIKSKTRFHSAERVIEEVEDIIRLNPKQKNITIYDDLFVIDKKKVKKISDLIVQEKIQQKVSFTCMGKADIFDEEFCHLLKRMNVKVMSFGFESGNQKILRYLKTDRSKVSDNQKVIDLCDKYGIAVGGYFIVGAPQETLFELGQTYWFIRKNTPPMSMFGAFSMTPFPGTKFWTEALEKKIVSEDMEDWSQFSYIDFIEGKSFFFNENYSVADFKRAYNSFYDLSPKNSVFILNNKEEEENELNNYFVKILKKLLSFSENDFVLEFSNNYFADFSFLTGLSSEKVLKINSWKFREKKLDYQNEFKNLLGEQKFPFIFLNYSLEQLINPFSFLTEILTYLESGGKLIILLKNQLNVYELANILLDKVSSSDNNFRKFDFFKELNIFSLEHFFQKNSFKPKIFQPFRQDISNLSYIYQKIIPLFKDICEKKIIENLDISNYLLVYESEKITNFSV